MDNDISQILMLVLGLMIIFLVVLVIVFIVLQVKIHKRTKVKKESISVKENKKDINKKEKNTQNTSISYNKQSILQ